MSIKKQDLDYFGLDMETYKNMNKDEKEKIISKVNNRKQYLKRKNAVSKNANEDRKCKECGEVKKNKDFYPSNMYKCKDCFHIEQNLRDLRKRNKNKKGGAQ